MKRIFQYLVVLSLILIVISQAIAWFYLPDDPTLVEFLALDGLGALYATNWPVYIFMIVSSVTITAALLTFHPLARRLFFVLVAVNLALTLADGYRFFGPAQSFTDYLASMLDGAILAFAYFTSVSHEFKKRAT